MKTFAIGDIHGGYEALLQCLKRSKFNYKTEKLIVLGDVCDGWTETKKCIDELMRIKNLIYIIGNHDLWALDWMKNKRAPDIWVKQGGFNTMLSYNNNSKNVPESHINLLENARPFYIDCKNRVFVHGGFTWGFPIEKQSLQYLVWDRELFYEARRGHLQENVKNPKLTQYKEVYIGHTSTRTFGKTKPLTYCEITNLDTGGGWGGKLTIMDIETKEYWQSDLVYELYPDVKGRGQ